MMKLKPCPFCGNNVRVTSYWQSYDCDYAAYKMEIECPQCGEFTLFHNTYRDGSRPKTCHDIWNTRVQEIYKYEIHGVDDADDWSED